MSTPLEDAANRELNRDESAPASGGADSGTQQPKRRGRPPGSKNKPKDGSSAQPKAPGTDLFNFVYVREQGSVDASAMIARTVWGLASVMLPVRPLTAEESVELGEALDPVLCRWLPVFGQWKYEAALIMAIYAMYETTKVERPKPPASDSVATVVENE